MGAPVYNFELDRGGRHVFTVAVTEADGTASDLTGYTGEVEIWSSYQDDATLLVTGTVSVNAGTGVVTITIPGSATEDAVWTSGVYDAVISASGSNPEYVARGAVRLRPTVTRP